MTTGGPEVAYGDGGKNGNLDQILYPIHHGMLYFVGLQVKAPFISFSPARSTDGERKLELERLTKFLSSVNSAKNLF